MSEETKTSKRFADAPCDKPQVERVADHGNLDRPGAQAHPRFVSAGADWGRYTGPARWTAR